MRGLVMIACFVFLIVLVGYIPIHISACMLMSPIAIPITKWHIVTWLSKIYNIDTPDNWQISLWDSLILSFRYS